MHPGRRADACGQERKFVGLILMYVNGWVLTVASQMRVVVAAKIGHLTFTSAHDR